MERELVNLWKFYREQSIWTKESEDEKEFYQAITNPVYMSELMNCFLEKLMAERKAEEEKGEGEQYE